MMASLTVYVSSWHYRGLYCQYRLAASLTSPARLASDQQHLLSGSAYTAARLVSNAYRFFEI
jgi:hypothetical protein